MSQIVILIPAAGASRRMGGRDKLMEPVGGVPLIARTARRALAVAETVFVTVPSDDDTRAQALRNLAVSVIKVPDAATGMSASLRAAVPHLPDAAQGVMVLPADMPDITKDDLRSVVTAFESGAQVRIVQATAEDGTPGHPVLFPLAVAHGFADLTGDEGARAIVKANASCLSRVPLPGNHAVTDLDTPKAWARWRASNPDL